MESTGGSMWQDPTNSQVMVNMSDKTLQLLFWERNRKHMSDHGIDKIVYIVYRNYMALRTFQLFYPPSSHGLS